MAAAARPLARSSAPHVAVIPGIRPGLPTRTGLRGLGTRIDLPGRRHPRTLRRHISISIEAILERREQFNRRFAGSLADWTSVGSDSPEVLTVEDVIPKVVFKVVEAGNRVLLIVLDGMSWAVCHELLDDIRPGALVPGDPR